MATSKTRIRGITIELNGDASGLSSELKNVNSDLSATQRALRDVDKLLKLDPGNTELLSQKQKLLNQALTETKQKLEIEKRALAELAKTDSTGQHQAEQDALQREIIETEAKVKSLEKAMQDFGSVGIQQVKAFGENLKEIGGKITAVGQQLTAKLTVPIVAGFTVAAKAASDYEENLNKMDVAFGQYSKHVREFTDNALDQFGLSKVAASDAASAFGALAKGVGLSEASAAQMSITLTGLSSDLSSYFNQSTDVSAKALEAIFTGESEALKKFGVVMTQTNLEDFAAAHGKVYSSASEAEKVMIRYNYVLEKTRDAQGDYSRSSDGFANTLRTFKSALEDLAVEIGKELLPILTPIIKKLTEWVKKFGQLPEGVKKAIVYFGLFVAALGPVVTAIGSVITAVGSLLVVLPALGTALGGAGLAGAAGVAGAGVATAGTAVAGFILPVVAATGVIVLLVKALLNVAENWDNVGAIAEENGRRNAAVIDSMTAKFKSSKLGQEVNKVATSMKTAFADAGGGIKGTLSAAFAGVWTVANSYAEKLYNRYDDTFRKINTVVINAGNSMRSSLSNAFNALHTTITSAGTSIRSSLTTAFGAIQTSASNAATDITNGWNTLKTTAATVWSGTYGSIKTSISDAFKDVTTSASNTAKSITDGWNTLKSTASSVWTQTYGSIKTTLSDAFKDINSSATTSKDAIKGSWDTLKDNAKSIFSTAYDSVKTTITGAFDAISKKMTDTNGTKDTINNSFKSIQDEAKNKFSTSTDSVKTTVTSVFDTIKTTISNSISSGKSSMSDLSKSTADYMANAKKTVSDTWTAMNTQMKQKLEWNLSGFNSQKPHIKTDGKFVLNSDGSIKTSPTIDIKWYRKAMQFGAILNGATIFGAAGGQLLGGGETGKEAVIGVNSLYSLVHNASANGNAMLAQRVDALTAIVAQYLPEIADQHDVVLDSGALVGQLVPAMNRGLGLALA